MKLRRRFVIVGMLAAAASARGQGEDDYINADRPGIADSSEVVARGRFQIETGLTLERRRTGEDPERAVFAPTLLRLGINERWEARLESDVHAWMREAGSESVRAYAPWSAGFKYRFLERGEAGLGAIVGVSPPSGSGALRTRHTTGEVRLVADWEFNEHWSLNPNLGLAVEEDDAGERFTAKLFAMTLAYKPQRTLELFVDMGTQTPEARGAGSAVIYDAGLAYLVSRDVQIDLSFGARGKGATPPRSFVAAGVSLRF